MHKKQEKISRLRKNYPKAWTFHGGEKGCNDQNHADYLGTQSPARAHPPVLSPARAHPPVLVALMIPIARPVIAVLTVSAHQLKLKERK